MAPIKFEENIKEKLENRTLKPSDDAWIELSNRLDLETRKKGGKTYWWLGIAASIIGVIFFVSKMSNGSSNKIDVPNKVVVAPIEVDVKPKNTSPLRSQDINIKRDENLHEQEINLVKHVSRTPVVAEQEPIEMAKTNILRGIEKESVIKPLKIEKTKLSFEEQKIQEVAAQISTLQQSNQSVSDQTIELLLERAQNEIEFERNKKFNESIVDATSLLESVEYELDESFRNKVFKALKQNLNKVKTAVAQRNE